jgi:glycerol-3-phosphate acyltransferase PlsX
MRIALDAMGGDRAPREIVRGALAALREVRGLEVVLIGDEARIAAELAAADAPARRVQIVHSDQVIGMDEPPVASLRRKPRCSIMRMARLAAEGQVDAAVSAGNTGACVAAMHKAMRRLEGVIRSGLAVTLPTRRGECIVCDVGANMAARPEHLYQYAVMADLLARHVHGFQKPRIALLSVGHEPTKGNVLVKDAYRLIEPATTLNFVGNLEGHDIFLGEADVFICGGFVGNVVLKVTEATGQGALRLMQTQLQQAVPALFAEIAPHWERAAAKHDYATYGGAPLLGINGVFVKCHGASGALAISNGIKVAARFAENHVNDLITECLGSARMPTAGGRLERSS